MSQLLVRKLLIDLSAPFPANWCGGDAFKSAFFNALSMSFPVGEQFFIDSVRTGFKTLPESEQAKFKTEVQGFVGQEATHRRIHALFNDHLETMGFTNVIAKRSAARVVKNAHLNIRMHVGATAATEHFTAIFAEWILRHPEVFDGTEERLKTMWLWHSAEESEHRSTAFDIYKALGGNEEWRIRLFHIITVQFLSDVLWQTVRNLWHDRQLFKLSTWKSAYQLLLSKDGLFRGNVSHWRSYKSPAFHPNQQDDRLSRDWLQHNQERFTVVGQSA
jgi:predicted metal-dependent hydrolase